MRCIISIHRTREATTECRNRIRNQRNVDLQVRIHSTQLDLHSSRLSRSLHRPIVRGHAPSTAILCGRSEQWRMWLDRVGRARWKGWDVHLPGGPDLPQACHGNACCAWSVNSIVFIFYNTPGFSDSQGGICRGEGQFPLKRSDPPHWFHLQIPDWRLHPSFHRCFRCDVNCPVMPVSSQPLISNFVPKLCMYIINLKPHSAGIEGLKQNVFSQNSFKPHSAGIIPFVVPTAPYEGALKLAAILEKTQALMGYGVETKCVSQKQFETSFCSY